MKKTYLYEDNAGGLMYIVKDNTAVAEPANYSGRNAYISDLAMSSVWGDSAPGSLPARLADLAQIGDACNRSVRDILTVSGLTQARFCARFCVPRRTVEDWCSGRRGCPFMTGSCFSSCLACCRARITTSGFLSNSPKI